MHRAGAAAVRPELSGLAALPLVLKTGSVPAYETVKAERDKLAAELAALYPIFA
jgi:hypothetical protein